MQAPRTCSEGKERGKARKKKENSPAPPDKEKKLRFLFLTAKNLQKHTFYKKQLELSYINAKTIPR